MGKTIVLLTKIAQPAGALKGKKEKDVLNPELITQFQDELKKKLKDLKQTTNVMLAFVGTHYVFYGLENTTEEIMNFMADLNKNTPPLFEETAMIFFNEECPVQLFPKYYVYEGEYLEKDNQIYKDMLPSEKGWSLYDNFFCNLGKSLRKFIHSDNDYKDNNEKVREAETNYVKYFPSINDVRVFMGEDYMRLPEFVKIYQGEIDMQLDDDVVYPYYWPIGTL